MRWTSLFPGMAGPEGLTLPEQAALLVALGLVAYAVLGGADFGGGIWHLLARGRLSEAERRFIHQAMGPVWEANHVWLIFALVVTFTAFPRAFSALAVALFAPLNLALVGLVVRGAAFTFAESRGWQTSFGLASLLTPAVLGMSLAGLVSAKAPAQGLSGAGAPGGTALGPQAAAALPGPFVILAALLAVAACAYLAAAFLSVEARGTPLEEAFRRKALGAWAAVAALGAAALAYAPGQAPRLSRFLLGQPQGFAVAAALVLALAAAAALAHRSYPLARASAALQVATMVGSLLLAQWPYLVHPELTLFNAAAPPATLEAVVGGASVGFLVVLPGLLVLWAARRRPAPPVEGRNLG